MSRRSAVKKAKILYLMHVDWHWIKQRPHFLAEQLSSEFDVLVVYPRGNNRSCFVRNATDVRRLPILQLPFSRFGRVAYLNERIRAGYFSLLMLFRKPRIVWLTFPTIIPQVALDRFRNVLVVYDCMDDASEFTSSDSQRSLLLQKEHELLRRADIVFVSSQNLREKVLGKGVCSHKLKLVHNAFDGREYIAPAVPRSANSGRSNLRVLFFGAIGDHLDFDVLLECLARCEKVEFHFIGPVMLQPPKHERMKFHGQVEHSCLATLIQPYDCFIMPFKLNELIQSVDPVKLYEYINFNKNIISLYYRGIERFSEFVFFYKNGRELVSVVESLSRDNQVKYNGEQRRLFLQSNNWQARATAITNVLKDKLISNSGKVL